MSAARDILRLARSSGGSIEKAVTRFDDERQCRVLDLTVTWPGTTGYDGYDDDDESGEGPLQGSQSDGSRP